MKEKDFYWFESWRKEAEANVGRRPSALLLWGSRGSGKTEFALEIITALLCQERGSASQSTPQPGLQSAPESGAQSTWASGLKPCGRCSSCGWMSARQHPDFRWVRPDADAENDPIAMTADGSDDGSIAGAGAAADADTSGTASEGKARSREIRIEQIRGLSSFAFVGSHRGGLRVVLISPAQKMNYAAANALLKVLEEPPEGLLFVLVADSLRGIPATILSRCRRQELAVPAHELPRLIAADSDATNWLLPLLSGSPNVDPLSWADKAGKSSVADALDLLMRWMVDVDRARIGLAPRFFPQFGQAISALSMRIRSAQTWVQTLAEIQRLRAVADHPLNPRLFYEGLFDRYRRALT